MIKPLSSILNWHVVRKLGTGGVKWLILWLLGCVVRTCNGKIFTFQSPHVELLNSIEEYIALVSAQFVRHCG